MNLNLDIIIKVWIQSAKFKFKFKFKNTLLPEFRSQGKTVIAVTHDDRYFHLPDRLVKMEYGQIVENQDLNMPPRFSVSDG